MKTYLLPFIDVTINALWSDWENYPAGRPNPLYSQQVKEWGADGLIFGFLTLSPSNNACWAAQDSMPLDWAVPLARELKSIGKRIIVSFGGASNADLSSKFTVAQLVETYSDVISNYSASGLDFDLENGLFDAQKVCDAAKRVQSNNTGLSVSFTLPVMPSGLTDTGMSIITQAKNSGLNFIVNGMAMDYYDPAVTGEMGKAATTAANSIKRQLSALYPMESEDELSARVAITPMIGRNDDPNEMFTLADADLVGNYGHNTHLNFVSMWSFNRDNPSSSTVADPISSSNPEQKVSGEYTQRFRKALGEDSDVPDNGPEAPAKLASFNVSQTSLTLKWLPPATGAAAYGIYRDGNLKQKTDTTTWADKGLVAGTEYTYFVTTWDKDGHQSPPSNVIKVTTLLSETDSYPLWKAAVLYSPGDRVTYKDKHYRCQQKHVAIYTWEPSIAYSLWTNID